MLLSLCFVSTSSCGAPFNGSATLIWPRPSEFRLLPPASGERSVGIMPELFKFQAVNASGPPGAAIGAPPALQAAFDRYFTATFPTTSGEICGYLLPSLDVAIEDLASAASPPREGDNESYVLRVPNSGDPATLRAPTLWGALRGLETFSQLVGLNPQQQYGIASAPLLVTDAPAYSHRGLMIDSGRRFIPVAAVQMLIDGMEASKLNVLHLHASDNCRWSVESKLYPQLTATLTAERGGFYTQGDVATIVAYARARGIRVVPEFDVPGHAKGLAPLVASGDAFFCDGNTSSAGQMFNDPAGKTLTTLKALFGEMAALFGNEAVLNIGADETSKKGVCTQEGTFELERALAAHIHDVLERDVQGWEELLFNAAASTPLPNGTIIAAWSRHRAADVVARGTRAIESHNKFFYLNKFARPEAMANAWADIGAGVVTTDRHLLLGGEVSMWTDNYCDTVQCGAGTGKPPVGAALFGPERDAEFTRSIGAMIFPGAAVGAGAFWNYDTSAPLLANSTVFANHLGAHTARLLARGVAACPSGCGYACDELSQCGVPYIVS